MCKDVAGSVSFLKSQVLYQHQVLQRTQEYLFIPKPFKKDLTRIILKKNVSPLAFFIKHIAFILKKSLKNIEPLTPKLSFFIFRVRLHRLFLFWFL